jgi:hypothetical protein
MMMVVMMVMMMVMVHRFGGHRRRPCRGAGDCGLREGVSGEAERERGRGDKGLDHRKAFLWLGQTQWVIGDHRVCCLN